MLRNKCYKRRYAHSCWSCLLSHLLLAACSHEGAFLLVQGVSIQNIGTFSFATKTVDIGNNRSIALQRPVFLLSEKFAQMHCIHYAKQHTPGEYIQ